MRLVGISLFTATICLSSTYSIGTALAQPQDLKRLFGTITSQDPDKILRQLKRGLPNAAPPVRERSESAGTRPRAKTDDVDDDVEERKAVQQRLSDLGHYSGEIDGKFGQGVRKSVRSWQKSIGAEQTGTLTKEQRAELLKPASQTAQSSPALPGASTPAQPVGPAQSGIPSVPQAGPVSNNRIPSADTSAANREQQRQAALTRGEQNVKEARGRLGADDPALADALLKLADAYGALSRYEDGARVEREALAIYEKSRGRIHPDTAKTQYWLANSLRHLKKWPESDDLFRRAITTYEQAIGKDSTEAAKVKRMFGLALREQKRLPEAESMFQQSLASLETARGPDADTIASLISLTSLLDELNRYQESESLHRRLVAARERTSGPDHEDVATALLNLGIAQRQLKRFVEAEETLRRCIRIREANLGLSHVSTANAYNHLARTVSNQNRWADAVPLRKRAAEIQERAVGAESTDLVSTLVGLGEAQYEAGNLDDAQATFRRSHGIRAKNLGPDHALTADTEFWLARTLRRQGRWSDALPHFERVLAIREKTHGVGNENTVGAVNALAESLRLLKRHRQAEPLFRRLQAIVERQHGDTHIETLAATTKLAAALRNIDQLEQAESQTKRALAIAAKLPIPDAAHWHGAALYEHGMVELAFARYSSAERQFRSALDMLKGMKASWQLTFDATRALAEIYEGQYRLIEAETLRRLELAMCEQEVGKEHAWTARALLSLASVLARQGRSADAQGFGVRAVTIAKKVGSDTHGIEVIMHVVEALGAGVIPGLHISNDAHLETSYAIEELFEKEFGKNSIVVANATLSLTKYNTRREGGDSLYLGGLEKAERIYASILPAGHPRRVAVDVERVRWAHSQIGRRTQQADLDRIRVATRAMADRWRRGLHGSNQLAYGELKFNKAAFELHALLAWDRYQQNAAQKATLMAEAFEAAQWANISSVGSALDQFAARHAKGDGRLAEQVRRLQDMTDEVRSLDQRLIAMVARKPSERDEAGEQDLRRRMVEVTGRLDAVENALKASFPEYHALVNSRPLTIAETQAVLGRDEALILFLFPEGGGLEMPGWDQLTSHGGRAWLVTKTEADWFHVSIGAKDLRDAVRGLRCGLDATGWATEAAVSRCKAIFEKPWFGAEMADEWENSVKKFACKLGSDTCTKPSTSPRPTPQAQYGRDQPLPFHVAAAHGLYKALFGSLGERIKDRQLLVVPTGAITSLPLQVLVTEPPRTDIPASFADYARISWLGANNGLTTLPSVSALQALRTIGKASSARDAYVGFGNPLLIGDVRDSLHVARAKLAASIESCPRPAATRAASLHQPRNALPILQRGQLANLDRLRAQIPLPETADELCAVGRSFSAPPTDIHLGARATEKSIKALSASGALQRYRVVHFATHGLLAGQTEEFAAARAEPSLLLTPPATASDEDDGLLTASEVAQLKLDSDWVVLSACNTAAGSDKVGAEALSGLARAFFYAGARAMLVSHWEVDSDSTVKIITGTFEQLAREPAIGRAEALRRSLSTMIASGGRSAHPANWAPFVVVGDGGTGR